jgi:hypothetical protein
MSNDTQIICPICQVFEASFGGQNMELTVDCPLCGRYRILSRVIGDIARFPKHILSAVSRNQWESTKQEFYFSYDVVQSIDAFIKASPIPIPRETDVPTKANLILGYMRRKSAFPGESVSLSNNEDYSIGFCKNAHEFRFCHGYLAELGLITEIRNNYNYHNYFISARGWSYLSGIGTDAKDHGFIAMAFRLINSDALHTDGLNPGISNAGYNPMRIDRKDHNNRIDDEIVAEIRKSKFVVADLTGKNAGAYFEAGFAMGLGKPVIWTCQQSEIDAGNVHFDTRQYSIVSWDPDNLADFATRLTQRIEATIGRGKYVPEPVTGK